MSENRRASQRTYHIIYRTTCDITGKWYIGMHSTDKLDDGYLGSGMHLWRSIDKYGKDHHRVEIIEYLSDRKSLSERERELLKEAKKDPLCMNIAWGGEGYYDRPPTTEETAAKLSKASKNYVRTKEWYEKAVATRMANDGYNVTSETKEKIRTALTGKTLTEEHKQKISIGGTGQKRTEETCKNISKALKGKKFKSGLDRKPVSKETRENTSKIRMGQKLTEEQRQQRALNKLKRIELGIQKANVRPTKKCTVDGIKIYASVREMVKELGSGKNGTHSPSFRFI